MLTKHIKLLCTVFRINVLRIKIKLRHPCRQLSHISYRPSHVASNNICHKHSHNNSSHCAYCKKAVRYGHALLNALKRCLHVYKVTVNQSVIYDDILCPQPFILLPCHIQVVVVCRIRRHACLQKQLEYFLIVSGSLNDDLTVFVEHNRIYIGANAFLFKCYSKRII